MKNFINSLGDPRLTILIAILFIANITLFSCRKESLNPGTDSPSSEPSMAGDRDAKSLCILSWNTHIINTPFGSFGGCSGGNCVDLAEDIANAVAQFDPSGGYQIIAFQEVWQTAAANALIGLMTAQGYPYNRYNHNSGLLTVSKLQIIGSTFVEYNDENGILGCANDALKDKGFLYTEIRVSDRCYIHFINTHLDAGSCEDDNSTRIKQLIQLDQWITARYNSHNPHEAFFLAGDFNMNLNNPSEFPLMMAILNDFTPAFSLAGTTPGYDALDYILIDKLANVSNVSYQSFPQGPSDHRPIESCMTYDCTSRPATPPGGGLDGDPCVPGGVPCPPGYKCIGGHCVEL